MATIPISQIAQVNPGVIGAGGQASRLVGVVLTQDASIPPGQPETFYLATDADDWFGPSTPETTAADNYFPGIINGGQLPYSLTYARYAATATPAGSYGANLGSLTLAQLQALTGTLIVTTAALHTSSTINLSTATSFADAASIMTAAFTTPDFAITYDTARNRFLLLTTATGPSATSTDVSGTLAAGVGLAQSAGAFIQTAGVAADTPATAMNRLVTQTTNWGSFTHAWSATLNDRLAFAQWNSGQNFQYWYLGWDADAADLTPNNAASFGAQVLAAPYQGTTPVYGTVATAAAFMGYAASINYNITNGRTTLAFRQFTAGTPATVSDLSSANALLTNGYTYIGAYANAANQYTIAYNGKTSGSFLWSDTYLDQIYLNRELQRANFEALLAYPSIPYNSDGYAELYQAALDVIDAAVTSGIIRAGVTLTNSEAQQINAAAGRQISDVVQSRGWYYLIGDPANVGQARQNRTSPAATLFWTDGGSVQMLNVNSIAVI